MKRRLFNILSALSLVLCVALGVLWVRSHWVVDDLMDVCGFGIESIRGEIGVAYSSEAGLWPVYRSRHESQVYALSRETLAQRCGFRLLYIHNTQTLAIGFAVPHWVPLATVAGLAALNVRHAKALLRRERLLAGLCPRCAYDVRASKGRCPECGTEIGMNAEG